jgi:hypothetical protein
MDRDRERSALEEALYRTHLPTHAGGDELPSCEYKTYIVTGFGQDFVRVYSHRFMVFRPNR